MHARLLFSFDVNDKIIADFLMTKWIYSKHILNGVGWGSGVLRGAAEKF